MNRLCSKCSAKLGAKNKTGLCLRHYNSDPGVVAGKAPAISRARLRKLAADPVFAASQRAHGKWLSQNFNGNDSITPEQRARVGKKVTETRIGWCPPELRPLYRNLVRNKGRNAAEAKRVILAGMSRFERQMQAVRNGAAIIEVRPR